MPHSGLDRDQLRHSAPGSATLHFEDDATLDPPDLVLTGNTFAWHGPESIFPFGIYTARTGQLRKRKSSDASFEIPDSQNTTTRARSRETHYVFLAVNRNDPYGASRRRQTKTERSRPLRGSAQLGRMPPDPAMAAGMALMGHC